MKRLGLNPKAIFCLTVFAAAAWLSPARAQVALDDELARDPTWKIPSVVEVRAQVIAWLDEAKPDEAVRQNAEALWPEKPEDEKAAEASPAQLLDRVVTTISLVDEESKKIADLCSRPHGPGKTPEFTWLTEDKAPLFVRNNMRLWLGKWLAQERLYEESLAQLEGLKPEDVVDPATLLFYQSVCHHWLLQKEPGLQSIGQLLEQRKVIPRRYEQLASLMQADLGGLKAESLDHISRRMNDVTRRLDLGHAGKRVRKVEDDIIASLDKLIEELEQQANSSGSGGGDGGQPSGNRSAAPAADSRIAGGGGPGNVDKKNIGNKSGWGDLPEKAREEAMQQIGKEFPSHYRDIIEQYFRKLASDEEEK